MFYRHNRSGFATALSAAVDEVMEHPSAGVLAHRNDRRGALPLLRDALQTRTQGLVFRLFSAGSSF